MLLNLLPGFREIRAPLAAGFLWLLFGWLVLPDSISLPPEFEDFADEFSALGKAAALSLGAYVAGSLLTDGLAPAWRMVRRLRQHASLSRWSKDELERESELRARAKLGRAHTGRDIQQIARETDRVAGHILWRLAAVEEVVGNSSEPLSRRGVLVVIELFAPRNVSSWSGVDPGLVDQVRVAARDLDIARFRLLSEERDLFNEVDRLRGEGQFKLAVASPLAALAIALGIVDHWLWLVALPAIALLAWQGLDKLEESGDRIADALRAGKVTIPHLEGARWGLPETDPLRSEILRNRAERSETDE